MTLAVWLTKLSLPKVGSPALFDREIQTTIAKFESMNPESCRPQGTLRRRRRICTSTICLQMCQKDLLGCGTSATGGLCALSWEIRLFHFSCCRFSGSLLLLQTLHPVWGS